MQAQLQRIGVQPLQEPSLEQGDARWMLLERRDVARLSSAQLGCLLRAAQPSVLQDGKDSNAEMQRAVTTMKAYVKNKDPTG